MKKHITNLIFLTLLSLNIHAQELLTQINDTTYLTDPKNKNVVQMTIKSPSGKLVTTGRLINGKKSGAFRTYDEYENISVIQEFYDGLPDGILLQFASNGAVNSEENYAEGKLDGKKVSYRFGGIKRYIEHYSKGLLDGTRITFYENGFKQEEANYKKGLRDGITRWYNQSEIITIEYSYAEGKLHGAAKTNYYSGKTESVGTYENDSEHGEWKYYDENGKLLKTILFDSGKKIKETLR